MKKILLGITLAAWLVVGSVAAGQRGYFGQGLPTSCTKAGSASLTVAVGPLNYQGLNPSVECHLPRPSA